MILLNLFLALAPQEQVVQQEHPQLVLYYSPHCPFCKNVLEYLRSIHKKVSLCNVQEKSACRSDLLEKGGVAQVPCLFIDGKPLYNDKSIIAWLSTHRELLED